MSGGLDAAPSALLLAALAGAAAVVFVVLLCWRLRSGRRPRSLAQVVRARQTSAAAAPGGGPQRRRIDDALREVAERQRAEARKRARPTLEARLRQAGLGWSRRRWLVLCAGVGSAVFLAASGLLGIGLLPGLGFGVAGAALPPHVYLSRRRDRRLFAAVAQLPDALDTIVRGVRSGQPVANCLRSVAETAQEPLRGEFRQLGEDLAVGLPLDDALARMARRCPALEIKLLGVILAIQNRAGGNLSEALGNLGTVLRDRKRMRAKIRAMSSEATASAGIIGSLPVAVALLLYLVSPDYIGLLFTTPLGQLSLVVCAVWMLAGVLVMRKMINFNF